MSSNARHTEWLSLVETSGPFLVPSVLNEVLPQGLEAVESTRRKLLRSVYDEWSEAVDDNDPDLGVLHREYVRVVLEEVLEYENTVFKPFDGQDSSLIYKSPDADVSFAPDFVLQDGSKDKPFLLVSVHPPGTDLEKVGRADRWPVTLFERMTLLCRSAGVRLGLITNGERWMLVNAPIESSTGHTSWYARLWLQEPITLQAFQTLLGVRRFFGPGEERLDALLDKSLEQQEEITTTLGGQVRRAVEVLIQALDRADQDRNRELLEGIPPAELYEAGLTVMMRSVFILCAEERGLLLLGDETYDQCYAISTMRSQLAADADRFGPEVLERRHDAWSRLLAMFRAVYGGIEHEALRMPALGGSLFDPDRFPFLEGRAKDTSWKDMPARPLPIDNRTVLLLLSALQVLEQRGGALLLSYKALDIEQIGHVYEGLLEHTVKRLPDTTLGFEGTKKVWNPNITLGELETKNGNSVEKLNEFLQEETGRSKSAIKNALKKEVEDATFGRIVAACGGDSVLADEIKPFAHLLRADAWGDFIVYKADSYAVTSGSDRRETGTHYTPKSLTEVIVEKTLEPIAYTGPAEGKPREEWQLKKPEELLDLKICDPAMGSGAFLVQVCRWLSRRLVEAWGVEEANDRFVTVDGEVLKKSEGKEPMPSNLDERLLIAKRLIAERCLYGVDINPLAVELAKMSIWLVTMSKGRPFGFLNHNLRSGDSLLGIHQLDQLRKLNLNPEDGRGQLRIFGQNVEAAVRDAMELRRRIRAKTIRDIADVEVMARLDQEAREKLESVELIADAMIGEALRYGGNNRALYSALDSLAIMASDSLSGNEKVEDQIVCQARESLSIDLPEGSTPRRPFHWTLEFPEAFDRGGFDGIVGNPPFLGGSKSVESLGSLYMSFLTSRHSGLTKKTDLACHFFRRADYLVKEQCCIGLIGTNSIKQGASRRGSLEYISMHRKIINAYSSIKWPGKAQLEVVIVVFGGHTWYGMCLLDDCKVCAIDPLLTEFIGDIPTKLISNKETCYIGVHLGGTNGFQIDEELAKRWIEQDHRNRTVLYPFIGGDDIGKTSLQHTPKWVVSFGEMAIDEAESYHLPFRHIKEAVFPERQKKNAKKYPRMVDEWWKFWHSRNKLYNDKDPCKTWIIKQRVTLNHGVKMSSADWVHTDMVVVFKKGRWEDFAILQSIVHEVWGLRYSSSLGSAPRYIPTDCYETFPWPAKLPGSLGETGKRLDCSRQEWLEQHECGLTRYASAYNNESGSDPRILELRHLQRVLDESVAGEFGWGDLDLGHGFHKTEHGIRYTISDEVRKEVLKRLLKLNQERSQEEVDKGLHIKMNKGEASYRKTTKARRASGKDNSDLFEESGK